MSFQTSPPVTFTITGTYETYFSDLTIEGTPYIPSVSFQETFTLRDGKYTSFDYHPDISITFHYDPTGLSSGSFDFQESDLTGYDPPSGGYLPGRNTVDATGTITQIAATPEPSSFALFGTGRLGACAALRRRYSLRAT